MLRNYVVIKTPKSDVNFDFGNARVTMSPGFGYVDPAGKNPYIPGIIIPPAVIPTGTTDTTGFSIMLNSRYNMMNPPVIVGTISYWDGQKLTYMQIKFGNSSTSQSIRATVTPGNILNVDLNNKPTYGSPLQLKVDGISSSIFNGITNVSYQQQALYSIVIYIEIIN
jgi:hypothetical protein